MKKYLHFIVITLVFIVCIGAVKFAIDSNNYKKSDKRKLGIVLKSIGLWGIKSPGLTNKKAKKYIEMIDKRELISYKKEKDRIMLKFLKSSRLQTAFVIEKNAAGIISKDMSGNTFYFESNEENKDIYVSNSSGEKIKYFPSEEVKSPQVR